MSHDQLSTSLIETFFADFLHLILPRSAARLRLDEAIFLDKEIFTDWPDGERRELDLLARVPVEEEEPHLLVHVEIEADASSGMDERLWRYYMQIRLRHRALAHGSVPLPDAGSLRLPGRGLADALRACGSWSSTKTGRSARWS